MAERHRPGPQLYDTTLRDGAQMPGVAFTRRQQLEICRALDDLGVDEIELGFAASGAGQRADMAALVEAGLRARTLSLARPLAGDIDAARETGVDGVIIFTSLSGIHLRHKLRAGYATVLDQALSAVAYARSFDMFVQVSMEDATRTELPQLVEACQKLAGAGVDRIGLADTVGVATQTSFGRLVADLVREIATPVSVHCHNDFGLAVANTLAAVEHGAAAISTTVNGIGERSGNAATEECAAALAVLYGTPTNIRLDRLSEVCRLVAEHAGVPIPANKAVVGANSFRHESGVHVAAMLREPACYEPYDPQLVGRRREFVMGKTSGRAAVRHLAAQHGVNLDDAQCQGLLEEIKAETDGGGTIGADRLRSLLERSS